MPPAGLTSKSEKNPFRRSFRRSRRIPIPSGEQLIFNHRVTNNTFDPRRDEKVFLSIYLTTNNANALFVVKINALKYSYFRHVVIKSIVRNSMIENQLFTTRYEKYYFVMTK